MSNGETVTEETREGEEFHMGYLTELNHKDYIGKRIEIPVHYDLWMRGARLGKITSYRRGEAGQSDYLLVRMDNTNVKTMLKLWRMDWPSAKLEG